MKTSLSGREPLNGAAEPGRDLLEIDVFDVTKSVRPKNRCNASRLETGRSSLAGNGACRVEILPAQGAGRFLNQFTAQPAAIARQIVGAERDWKGLQ
jgi:hypothetical protein